MLSTAGPPDEFWQGPEVAYTLLYGKGGLTWEWTAGLRSYLHPALFGGLFATGKGLGVDTAVFVQYAPKVLQGLIAAAADCTTYVLAARIAPDAGKYTLLFSTTNWFIYYCSGRTLVNGVEALFVLYGVLCYRDGRYLRFLYVAGVATALRCTSVVTWGVCVVHMLVSEETWRAKLGFVWSGVRIAVVLCVCSVGVDSVFHGAFVFTHWEFVKFNFIESRSALFGTHPAHWYFTQGFPAMLGTTLPFFLYEVWYGKTRFYAGLCAANLLLYSLIGHKEFRFVLPALYFAMIVVANGAVRAQRTMRQWTFRGVLLFILLTNVAAGAFFGHIHKTGGIAGMVYVRNRSLAYPKDSVVVHSLLPCYATPGYSFVHGANVKGFRQMECIALDGSRTEQDVFEASPVRALVGAYVTRQDVALPTFFLVSSHLEEVHVLLKEWSYTKVVSLPHTPVPTEGIGSEVFVFEKGRDSHRIW